MKIKKWLPLLLAGLMTFSVIGFAGCDNGSSEGGNTAGGEQNGDNEGTQGGNEGGNQGSGTDEVVKWFDKDIWLGQTPLVPSATDVPSRYPDEYNAADRSKDVSVHDPSIFHDPVSGKYYAFGSHFMVASTRDFISWKQEVGDGSSEESGRTVSQKLYGTGVNWRNVLKESVAYAGTSMPSTWAPHVEYYSGKYYMYVSLTSGFGESKSVISRVSSDNVLGPYANEEVILKTPSDKSSATPNAIDPELFYDKDGKLWMVYGSHFAGVYIKELYNDGENWGLPKEDGWGKLLWKGGSQVVEGPYIFYNATNDYYYLMTTYGALQTTYNMRIARSKNPNGPYVDAEGTDLATSSNNGTLHGNVVAGNFKFSWTNGYAAMGHNSVIKDKSGRYFVIYHSRYQSGATGVTPNHNLFVNQLFFNEDGWPVMSPTPYVGEKPCPVEEAQVTGDYEIVLHSTATTQTFVNSETYTLSADGKVTKGSAEVGTWTLKQNFYIDVTINEVTYKGVVALGWNNYSNTGAVFSITAISDKGYSLWGVAKTVATKA